MYVKTGIGGGTVGATMRSKGSLQGGGSMDSETKRFFRLVNGYMDNLYFLRCRLYIVQKGVVPAHCPGEHHSTPIIYHVVLNQRPYEKSV